LWNIAVKLRRLSVYYVHGESRKWKKEGNEYEVDKKFPERRIYLANA